METLILLLVLALSEKNAELKETVRSVLSFYRENRELLVSLAGAQSSPTAQSSPESPPAQDGLKLIEEFLKRQKV